jgi:alkylhydroperoxidase family enzyme
MARLSYVTPDRAPPAVLEEYERLGRERGRVGLVYQMLAHNPGVLSAALSFGRAFNTQSRLARPLQELATLRVTCLTQADYEWAHHGSAAVKRSVLSQEKLDALGDWQQSRLFDLRERAVLRCADEMTRDICLSEEGFAELRRHFDEDEAADVIFLVAYRIMMTRILRATEVDLEPEFVAAGRTLPRLPD